VDWITKRFAIRGWAARTVKASWTPALLGSEPLPFPGIHAACDFSRKEESVAIGYE
jgi:hypothetical protein